MSNLNKSHSGATPSASGAIFLHRLGRASRGFALTAAFLAVMGTSLAQAQSYVPAPGYTWDAGDRGKFHIGQDSFDCPQPMLNIIGFSVDGDGWNNTRNWQNSEAASLSRARVNGGGNGFGGGVALSIPLSGSIGRDCKEMAKQFLDERRLNTAVSKFRNCVYLQQTGINFIELVKRLKKREPSMNPQKKAELEVLFECSSLGITFIDEKPKVENVEVEETEKKTEGNKTTETKTEKKTITKTSPRPKAEKNEEAKVPSHPASKLQCSPSPQKKCRGIQMPYEDPGSISGEATKARPLDMSGFGYYQPPVQRYRKID